MIKIPIQYVINRAQANVLKVPFEFADAFSRNLDWLVRAAIQDTDRYTRQHVVKNMIANSLWCRENLGEYFYELEKAGQEDVVIVFSNGEEYSSPLVY